MTIETKRLLLRPWKDEDAEDLYLYARDPRVGPMAGWPVHTSPADSLQAIRSVLSQPETYAVVLKETGKPVGSVGILFEISRIDGMTDREAEIGYWIGVPYWGQGLIPEAVEALIFRCFRQLDRCAVWCGYYDGNDKSRRVQEKCGFCFHHTEYDQPTLLGDRRTEHFSYLTKEQWETARA